MTSPDRNPLADLTRDGVHEVLNTGALYRDYGEGLGWLEAERVAGKELIHDYNATRPSDATGRERLLARILGTVGTGCWIEPPLRASYGTHVHIGNEFYANFNLTLVDDAEIHIGDRVMIAPNVTVTTAGHPIHPEARVGGNQFSLPVHISDDVWIGANVVILPGVRIGAGSIIGAGSVVTRDVPPMVVAVGVPCRVLRPITDADRTFLRPPGRDGLA